MMLLKRDLLLVMTGPGVSTRDRDIAFDMGFTRKTGGRGWDYSVSKRVFISRWIYYKVDSHS